MAFISENASCCLIQCQPWKVLNKPSWIWLKFPATQKSLLFFEPFDTSMYRENSIPSEQKFTYVKKLLILDLAAKIKGFPFTDKSYEEALRLLKHIYGNNQVVVHSRNRNSTHNSVEFNCRTCWNLVLIYTAVFKLSLILIYSGF